MELKIHTWPIANLRPYTRTLRKNDHAVKRMMAAIDEFGFRIPLLVRSDGELIDGHLRRKAAEQLGLAQVPVILCDDWTPTQVKAFRLLVNRSATWADWDQEALAFEMAELDLAKFNLQLTGFTGFEIDSLLQTRRADAAAEAVPDRGEQAVSRRGDLWLCGSHRVLCGDATSADDVARLLASQTPVLMITDPPYGVQYDPGWREEAGLGIQRQTGKVENDDRVDWTSAYRFFPGDVAYVWHAGVHATEVAAGLASAGFDIRAQIIWAKQHFALSRGHYHWQHEPCWYAVRRDRPAPWYGDRKQSTLWQLANLNPFGGSAESATGHGTQKPLELMRRPMLHHTQRGDTVYDPFLGSGTTLVAAELSHRHCLGMDIDPLYVDVIVERWQGLTGKPAMLAGGDQTFEEIRSLRIIAGRGEE